MKVFLPLLLLLFLFFLAPAQAQGFADPPETVCSWMEAKQFVRQLRFTPVRDGLYRCTSKRKPMGFGEPVASDVRFVAEGSESDITGVRLEMRMRSYRHPQQTLRKFLEYANFLSSTAVSNELPEEVRKAILSGIAGKWPLPDRTIELQRRQDHGNSYDYHFLIY